MKKAHPLALLALTAALGLCACLPAAAAGKADAVRTFIQTADPDKDGTLDLAEVKQAAEAKFDKLEKDKDGTLDRKEIKGLGIKAADFKKVNPDKDGTLDKTEYVSLVEARFKAADPDGDGTLDAKELKTPAGRALLKLIR